MIKKIKNILMLLLAIFTVLSVKGVTTYADEAIESGIYTIENSVYHESETGMSMSRSYLDEEMTMEVREGSITYTIGFSGTQYMDNYRIKINGEEVPTEIVDEDENAGTIKLKVTTDSFDNEMAACIYVDPMGRDVEFQIIPELDTMTLVEAIEEDEEVIEETEQNNNENTNVDETSSDENQDVDNEEVSKDEELNLKNDQGISIKTISLIGVGVIIVLGIVVFIINKKR